MFRGAERIEGRKSPINPLFVPRTVWQGAFCASTLRVSAQKSTLSHGPRQNNVYLHKMEFPMGWNLCL